MGVKMARYGDLPFKQKLGLFFPIHHTAQILPPSHVHLSGAFKDAIRGKGWEWCEVIEEVAASAKFRLLQEGSWR
jgi:hypothetical protein